MEMIAPTTLLKCPKKNTSCPVRRNPTSVRNLQAIGTALASSGNTTDLPKSPSPTNKSLASSSAESKYLPVIPTTLEKREPNYDLFNDSKTPGFRSGNHRPHPPVPEEDFDVKVQPTDRSGQSATQFSRSRQRLPEPDYQVRAPQPPRPCPPIEDYEVREQSTDHSGQSQTQDVRNGAPQPPRPRPRPPIDDYEVLRQHKVHSEQSDTQFFRNGAPQPPRPRPRPPIEDYEVKKNSTYPSGQSRTQDVRNGAPPRPRPRPPIEDYEVREHSTDHSGQSRTQVVHKPASSRLPEADYDVGKQLTGRSGQSPTQFVSPRSSQPDYLSSTQQLPNAAAARQYKCCTRPSYGNARNKPTVYSNPRSYT